MAGQVSPGKAKDILRHGEVRGHPLTEKQKGFFGARAGGAPLKTRNAPVFPVPNDEEVQGIMPQEREALAGPSGSFVGDPTGNFGGRTGEAFDGQDAFSVKATHPDHPLNDADFPTDATFDAGTRTHLETGGV